MPVPRRLSLEVTDMALFDPKHNKGPAALANVKYRFMALTQDIYRANTYGGLLLDAVTDETLANKADVPTHPTANGTSVSDHAVKGNRSYTIRALLGNQLEQEHFRPEFDNPADQQRVVFYPSTAAVNNAAEREASFSQALEGFLGVPVTIYSPRYGKLSNFVLTSYNDKRDGSTRVEVDLSFQEVKIASVDRVLIPKLERAKAQAKPEELGPCSLTDEELEAGEETERGNKTILYSSYTLEQEARLRAEQRPGLFSTWGVKF